MTHKELVACHWNDAAGVGWEEFTKLKRLIQLTLPLIKQVTILNKLHHCLDLVSVLFRISLKSQNKNGVSKIL